MRTSPPLIVLGAGGRIGRLLRSLWGQEAAIWLGRAEWDILQSPAPLGLPQGAVWVNLAGVITGDCPQNPQIAARVADAVHRTHGRHLYLSTAAVYSGGPRDMSETDPLAPVSAYGRSKQQAEAVLAGHFNTSVLRLGNLIGADALFSAPMAPRSLDPIGLGPKGPQVIERVVMQTTALQRLLPLPKARATDLVADLNRLQGWPR